jgi:hypothetical protein
MVWAERVNVLLLSKSLAAWKIERIEFEISWLRAR